VLPFLERLTGRRTWPWLILLLFTPLGYVVGGRALSLYDPHASIGIAMTRDEAVAIARRFVASKGLAVGTATSVRMDVDNALRKYEAHHGAAIPPLKPYTQPVGLHVLFSLPKGRASVLLAPDGHVEGWDLGTAPGVAGASPDGPPVRAAAKALEDEFGPVEAAKFQAEGSARDKEGGETFTSRRRFGDFPGLSVRSDITVRNHLVTAVANLVEIDPASGEEQHRSIPRLVFIIGTFLFMAGYVLFQFVRRLREQEVPVARSVVIAATVAILFVLTALLTDNFGRNTEDDAAGILLAIVIGMTLVGIAVGITWAACEGDVREVYPSRLVSFDALLGRRGYSRTVARSVLWGIALGSICILASGLGAFLTRNGWRTVDVATVIMARAPVLAVLISAVVGPPLLAGFGLLIPISLLRKRIESRLWLGVMAAVLLCFVNAIISMGDSDPRLPGVVATIVSTAALVLPFFAADLLAMFVANTVATSVIFAVFMLSQPGVRFHTSGVEVLVVLLLLAVAAVATALRGPELAGATLAPRYAGNIAERLSLQAERSASRQAQLRILPRQLPQSELVSIAAECRSIDADSSDYYDIIELGGGRLGVLLASCSAPGLSAALTITMLKGLLTSYASRWSSPFDVMTRVRWRLTGVFGDHLQLSIFYAVVDPSEHTLDLARLGDAPHLIAVSPGRSSRVVEPQILRADGEGALRIEEGRASFSALESLVINNAPPDVVRTQDLAAVRDASTSAILSALFRRTRPASSSAVQQNAFSAIVISWTSPTAAMP
jgi:hypothetical protein